MCQKPQCPLLFTHYLQTPESHFEAAAQVVAETVAEQPETVAETVAEQQSPGEHQMTKAPVFTEAFQSDQCFYGVSKNPLAPRDEPSSKFFSVFSRCENTGFWKGFAKYSVCEVAISLLPEST